MRTGVHRRAFLLGLPVAALAADPAVAPSEARKYRDAATEFDLTRLTDPEKSNCWLPRPPLRALDRQDATLLYVSDRSGTPQAWRMDIRTGQSRQWTYARALVPSTVTFGATDRAVVYFDGSALIAQQQQRPRTVCALEPGWEPAGPFALAEDGSVAAFAERRGGAFRLRLASLSRGTLSTFLESPEPVRFIRFRPRHQALAYGHAGALAIISYEGRGDRHVKIAEGRVLDAQWAADGKAIHYLSALEGRPVQLREFFPELGEDKLVGATTQFVTFARNTDSSVFAGVSGSKASPYVLLLLRAARRELTVAEHRASHPERACVLFSASSQRLYYQTDRQGRSAIYTMSLERFVEKTEVSARRPAPRLLDPA